ncbi:hypothetical protein GGX14DRAFT_399613 [Mycena pura]|uniref:Uncharacterized protein n=1 Tax=Mycena pura TaxID=153505 RepID=A0AAD6V7X4_9AGAR|nr:hypothetical protein GGX14DRAFT_399613 [Mycena pura]
MSGTAPTCAVSVTKILAAPPHSGGRVKSILHHRSSPSLTRAGFWTPFRTVSYRYSYALAVDVVAYPRIMLVSVVRTKVMVRVREQVDRIFRLVAVELKDANPVTIIGLDKPL